MSEEASFGRRPIHTVLTVSYRLLFIFFSAFNVFYILISLWDFHSFSKWPLIPIEIAALILLGFFHYVGFAGSRWPYFPFSKSFWSRYQFLILVVLVSIALVCWVLAPPFAVIFGTLFLFYLCSMILAAIGLTESVRTVLFSKLAKYGFVISVAILIVLLEFMNRTWYFGLFQLDPKFGIALRENRWYGINSSGFRGLELSLKKSSDSYRVLFLGDSSTFGIGVPWDKTYAQKTVDCLNKRAVRRFEAINAAVPGYNLLHMLWRWESLQGYEPDLVVVMAGFNYRTIQRFTIDREVIERRVTSIERIVDRLERAGITFLTPPALIYIAYRIWGSMDKEDDVKNLALFSQTLESVFAMSQSRGVPLLFLIYPSFGVDIRVQDSILRFAKSHEAPVIDSRAAFQRSNERLLMSDGIHPNTEGHRVLSELLCDYIGKKASSEINSKSESKSSIPSSD